MHLESYQPEPKILRLVELFCTKKIYKQISNRGTSGRESCSVLCHVRVGRVIPFWQFNLLSGEIELSRVDLFLEAGLRFLRQINLFSKLKLSKFYNCINVSLKIILFLLYTPHIAYENFSKS